MVRDGAGRAGRSPRNRELQRDGSDALGGGFGDAFDCFGDLCAVGEHAGDFLLHVEVLGVLADDYEVDVFSGDDAADGADVCVEVEGFAEGDDGGGVAGDFCGGGGDGAEECTVAFGAEGVDGGLGEGGAGALEGGPAGVEGGEGEGESEGGGEGFEEAAAGGDDFEADAVAGDEAWGGLELSHEIENEGLRAELGRIEAELRFLEHVPMRRLRIAARVAIFVVCGGEFRTRSGERECGVLYTLRNGSVTARYQRRSGMWGHVVRKPWIITRPSRAPAPSTMKQIFAFIAPRPHHFNSAKGYTPAYVLEPKHHI